MTEDKTPPKDLWRIGTGDLERYIEEAYARTAKRIAAGEIDDAGEQD